MQPAEFERLGPELLLKPVLLLSRRGLFAQQLQAW